MRGFRGGVSGKGFTGGGHGCPFSVRRHRPPPAPQRYTPERREAARTSRRRAPLSRAPKCSAAPNVAAPHFPKHQHSTALSQASRRYTPHQDVVHPTKTLHCPPKHCAAHQDAALLQVPQCYAPPNIAALRIPQMAKARRCSLFGYENVRTIAAFMPKFPAFIPNMPPRAPSDGEHRRVFAKSKPPRAA